MSDGRDTEIHLRRALAMTLQDVLLAVGEVVPLDVIRSWTPEQKNQLALWAALTQLAARDKRVFVPPRPALLAPANKGCE